MSDFVHNHFDLKKTEVISVIDELPLWSAPFGLKLLDIIRLRKNIQVLDIGCGLGFPLLEFAMRLGSTCKLYGIDPWKEALERVKTKIDIYNIRNVELIEGLAENTTLDDNSIDLIISNNGLNNIEDKDAVMTECYRVCKEDAQIVFTANLELTMYEFYQVFGEVLKDHDKEEEIDKLNQHIQNKRHTYNEWVDILEKHQFHVNNVIHDSFNMRFADGTSFFNHFLINIAFLKEWKKIVKEEDHQEIFSEIESRLNEKSNTYDELNLTIPYVVIDARIKKNS